MKLFQHTCTYFLICDFTLIFDLYMQGEIRSNCSQFRIVLCYQQVCVLYEVYPRNFFIRIWIFCNFHFTYFYNEYHRNLSIRVCTFPPFHCNRVNKVYPQVSCDQIWNFSLCTNLIRTLLVVYDKREPFEYLDKMTNIFVIFIFVERKIIDISCLLYVINSSEQQDFKSFITVQPMTLKTTN